MRVKSWQKTELSKVLQERNEKNIDGYVVCSVSVSQGVVNQIEYLGRSFAAKETTHYNVVKYGDIIYTKSPLQFHLCMVYISRFVIVSELFCTSISCSQATLSIICIHLYRKGQRIPSTLLTNVF